MQKQTIGGINVAAVDPGAQTMSGAGVVAQSVASFGVNRAVTLLPSDSTSN